MFKILIADDIPSDGKSIELLIKKSLNSEIDVLFQHVNDLNLLEEKIQIYKPALLLLDIKWGGIEDAGNAGLNFILKLSPGLFNFKLYFISSLVDADHRKQIAGLSGFKVINKSYIQDFPFTSIVKAIQVTNELERQEILLENLERFKLFIKQDSISDNLVMLYKNAGAGDNDYFDQYVLLNEIVCIEGAGHLTNIYINKKLRVYIYSQNTSKFINTKIINHNLFHNFFKSYGRKNNLFINKAFISLEQAHNGKTTITVKADVSKTIFTTGY